MQLCGVQFYFIFIIMSLPVSRGACSQFISYLVQLVSLLYIYSPSVSSVISELLNVMVCVLLFVLVFYEMPAHRSLPPPVSQLLHSVTVLDWHVSLSASLSLDLVQVKYLSTVKITFTQVVLELVTCNFQCKVSVLLLKMVFRYSLHL